MVTGRMKLIALELVGLNLVAGRMKLDETDSLRVGCATVLHRVWRLPPLEKRFRCWSVWNVPLAAVQPAGPMEIASTSGRTVQDQRSNRTGHQPGSHVSHGFLTEQW